MCCLTISFILAVFFEFPVIAFEKMLLADVVKLISSRSKKVEEENNE